MTPGASSSRVRPNRLNALRSLARGSGATPFMALLAVFKLTLARYCGGEDIVVGLPTTNRNHSVLSDIIGVFINTVILRTDLSGDVTFRELLDRVRKTTLEAQANQELPFDRVVRALDLHGDSGGAPIPVLFDLQRKSDLRIELPGLSLGALDVPPGAAKVDLVFALEETGTELVGRLDYDRDRLDAQTARQFVRHFVALMKSAAAQPDIPVSRLPMMTAEEHARLTSRGLDTAARPGTWPDLEVGAWARSHPEALAVASDRIRLSYRDLHANARRLATFLRRQNVESGQRVALFLDGGPELVVAQLAVMMTGAAFVPIDPAYPPSRVAFMIRDCDAALVLASAESPRALPASARVAYLDRAGIAIADDELLDQPGVRDGSDSGYIIYTSGSTGEPKGVCVPYAALANLIAWHRRAFAITNADRASQIASVAFDASVWEIWPHLVAGASVHFPPRALAADPAGLRDWLISQQITISFLPTPLAEGILGLDWPADVSLRWLLTGGDRLRKRPDRRVPFRLVNNYGPTENTVVSTSGLVPSSQDGHLPSIGRPIDNTWVRIVGRNLEAVPHGAAGELLIGGRSLATGYWNRPEPTAEAFVTLPGGERAYRTGDIGRFRRDGEIEFLGRVDTQVKVRGYRIELREIEGALLSHQAVRDCLVEVREFAGGEKRIVAHVVPVAEPASSRELRRFLADRLPRYMVPSHFARIESVPRTAHGKVNRSALSSPGPDDGRDEARVEPRNATERQLAEIWRDLLGTSVTSVRDDFFELGGHSLLATRMATAVRDRFDLELPLARIIERTHHRGPGGLCRSSRPIHARDPGMSHPAPSGLGDAPTPLPDPPRGGESGMLCGARRRTSRRPRDLRLRGARPRARKADPQLHGSGSPLRRGPEIIPTGRAILPGRVVAGRSGRLRNGMPAPRDGRRGRLPRSDRQRPSRERPTRESPLDPEADLVGPLLPVHSTATPQLRLDSPARLLGGHQSTRVRE